MPPAVMFGTTAQTTGSLQANLNRAVQAVAPAWMLQAETYPPVTGGKLYKWALNTADEKLSIWVIQYRNAAEADARLRGIRLSVGEQWVTGVGDAAFVGVANHQGPASLYLRAGETYAQIFVPGSAASPSSTAVDIALRLGQRVGRILSEG